MSLPCSGPSSPVTWPGGTMRAVVVRGPGELALTELPVPGPEPGQVLVAPARVGLCGTDLDLLHGTAAYVRDGRTALPQVPGHEWYGRVVARGPGCAGSLRPGSRVVGHTMLHCGLCPACARGRRNRCARMREVGLYGHQGAAAEYLRLPEHALSAVPDAVSDEAAVLVEPAVTVVAALEEVRAGAGETVAVLGTGTVGLLAVRVARQVCGAVDVIGVDERGLALAAGFGARAAYSPGAAPRAHYDVVVEASGAVAGFVEALALTGTGGRVAQIGIPQEPVGVDVGDLVLRGITVHGVRHGLDHYGRTLALFERGVLDAAGMTGDPLPLARAAEAFALLERDDRPWPKVTLDPGA